MLMGFLLSDGVVVIINSPASIVDGGVKSH